GYLSVPREVVFDTRLPPFDKDDGAQAYAYYYPPANKDFRGMEGEKPPLLVLGHGGPTSATNTSFSLRIQFWTSRGFAVADVNYGGSTGYGRAFRERLYPHFGQVDVQDCCAAALHLADRGLADRKRLSIMGGSAGGYTTLSCLAFRPEVFAVGASHYGISDLEVLAKETHKFESMYPEHLVGPYPAARATYIERSPVHSPGALACPVIFFQGLDDKVVPPNQTSLMVDALRRKGLRVAHVEFEGEQHGFRKFKNIVRAMEAQLFFFGRILGFVPCDTIDPVPIYNDKMSSSYINSAVPDTSDRMLFAVPKKGRLYDHCVGLLSNIGIEFNRKPRHDIALVTNMPIALVFLPAADIAAYVAKGSVDLGITGLDIIRESQTEDDVAELIRLGFGKCKLQIQAPAENHAVKEAKDLVGKRIVTSFINLTRQRFAELEGVDDPMKIKTQVRFVSGSVEAACGLGLADGIVDLVESGDTMRAAGLHSIDTLMDTESVLITNQHARFPQLAETIKQRVEGILTARKYVLCQYNIARTSLDAACMVTPGRQAPTITSLEQEGWVAISVMVEKRMLAEKMDALKEIGAADILVLQIANARA
ncbi:Esterase lipase thioesterase active site, partial [Coemansia sp. RSA 2399]